MFKIRTAEALVTTMIDYFRGQQEKVNDFRLTSRTRSIFEAVGNMGEELYYNLWQGIKALIEEQIYKTFDFGLNPATKSEGTVTFGRNTPAVTTISIASGTYITTESQESVTPVIYETTANAAIPAGSMTVTAPVRALKTGTYSHVLAGKLNTLQSSVNGVDYVTNTEAIVNGTDQETKEARKLRFQKYISSRSQGTNEALVYAAEQVAGVTTATIRENPTLTLLVYSVTADLYMDQTYETNNPFGNLVYLFSDNQAKNGDLLLFGASNKFNFLYIKLSDVKEVTGVWEYWNGLAWVSLPVTDNTSAFTKSGTVTFTEPTNWRTLTISNYSKFWIRFRATSGVVGAPTMQHAIAAPPPGFVDVYIQDENAEASTTLITNVATAIAAYRGSGVTINVKAPTKTLLDVSCRVRPNPLYETNYVLTQVETLITDYLNGFELAQNFVLSRLENEILNLQDAAGYLVQGIEIAQPLEDMLASAGEIFRPGAISAEVAVS